MTIRSISATSTGIEQLLVWSRRVGFGLLAVGFAYALSQSGRMFAGPANAPLAEDPTKVGRIAPVSESTGDATQQVALQYPFGAPNTSPVAAPAAKPSLQLVGILSVGEKHGLALIASGDGREEVFAVGETLPGGAILKGVHLDRVLLDGNGGLETLWLPRNRRASAENFTAESPSQSDDQAEMPQSLVDYRDRFLSASATNPDAAGSFETSGLAQFFAPVTTETGSVTGYRLLPGSREPPYEQIGLQPNDVLITVNGIPLSQPENSVRALRRLESDQLASVTFIRDGDKIIDVTIMRDKNSNAP